MLHAFEKAGLGKAPFKYVGMVAQDISYGMRVIGNAGGIPITTKPGGTCAYCGQYIVNMFNVKSADDKTFHVGCDCIKKVGDAGLIKSVNTDLKKSKLAKDTARIDAAKAKLPEVRAILAEKPHPSIAKLTLADYIDWLLANAGIAGRLRAAKMVEEAK